MAQRIEPRHFTVYHDPVPGVTSPEVQAAILAFQASFLPGFLLGFGCVIAAWAGDWPRLTARFVMELAVGSGAGRELLSRLHFSR